MTHHRPYPSDLSDARWELIGSTLTAWRTERRSKGLDIGRPPQHDLRRIMDAILYVDRTGIPWRYLPHDFPPWETVYGYFAAWQKDGIFDQLNGILRQLVRQAEGRDAEPSACVLDAQSIKTSANVPVTGQGIDAGKKIAGRKRHLGVDTLGCCWRSGSPLPASPTTSAASTCSPGSPPHTRRSEKPGPTPATAPKPSSTAPAWASTSKPSTGIPPRKASR